MKKNEGVIYIVLFTLLLGVVIGVFSLAIIRLKDNSKKETKDNNTKTEEKNNPKIEDGVKLSNIYKTGNNIIEEFEITLNGNIKKVNVTYTATLMPTVEGEDAQAELSVKSNLDLLNDIVVYDVYFSEDFTIEQIKRDFNESNFVIIKGTDNKNYLAIFSLTSSTSGNGIDVKIVNDEYKEIGNFIYIHDFHGFEIENNQNIWYPDSLNKGWQIGTYGQYRIKIVDNEIYYLDISVDQKTNTGKVEEKVYTINNNKLTSKTINTYKITEITGSSWW